MTAGCFSIPGDKFKRGIFMNISITKCIRELNRNRNVEELLPEYVKQSRNYYGSHACFKLALEYFMFFENIS